MKRANYIRGRIESHSKGFGTADEDILRVRAREIAITNGRRPEDFNQADLDEARQELEAVHNASDDPRAHDEEGTEEEVPPRDGPSDINAGKAAPTKAATDEQTFPEQLVEEGVDEATHERMMEGNRDSQRKDRNFEDQLPSSE
jgi:hypothetical protein